MQTVQKERCETLFERSIGALSHSGCDPRHTGQRRVTLLGNIIVDDGPAIPLEVWECHISRNNISVDTVKI